MDAASQLTEYVRTLSGFEITTDIDGSYNHMGATLTDAVLQAGVKYETVVRPRVKKLLAEEPEARTTSGFFRLLVQRGATGLLTWSGGRKIDTLADLIRLLMVEGIETEEEFRNWVQVPENFERLRTIKGIKDKTANYILILLGLQSVAIDRHLLNFVAEAGLPTRDNSEAHLLISQAAVLLNLPASVLDHSIWRYMSERSTRSTPAS